MSADSLVNNVTQQARLYRWYIQSYDAKTYIKGTTEVLKKNILLRFAPNIFTFDKRGRETILEALVDVQYKAPNHYTQNITALTGTRTNPDDIYERLLQFLNINVYNAISFNDEILMPFAPNSSDYYLYYYEGVVDTLNTRLHRIRIEPRNKSPKVISALVHVLDGFWSVACLEAKGKTNFADFELRMDMGTSIDDFLLPRKLDLFLEMNLLGNHVVNHYTSIYEYRSIVKHETLAVPKRASYDVSDYFSARTDSVPIIKDSLFWRDNRPVPLTEKDSAIYRQGEERIDTSSLKKDSWRFTRMMTNPLRFHYRDASFRYSGFLNPLKVGYSATNGLSYSQQLRLECPLGNGRSVGFYPDLGYVFGTKEFFFRLPLEWLYAPEKFGIFEFSIGNGNQGLTVRDIQNVNEHLKDSAFKFEDFNLAYYRHYYAEVKNRIELANGLLLDLAATYHYRTPVIRGEPTYVDQTGEEEVPEKVIEDELGSSYRSFVPHLSLTWTPRQYYRIYRQRKIYVQSACPTFSLKYAKGVKDLFRSDADFDRFELDVQQRIALRELASIHYYAGVGAFTRSRSVNFVEFNNFTKRNFPESWDSKIGGVFHLLNDYWYVASDAYLQTHVMYESPFIFLRLIKNVSKYVIFERLYAGQLCLPKIMPSYTEFGYGIGNALFNAGVFAGMKGLEFQRVGFKFTFEL
jgi:hypothetical protein